MSRSCIIAASTILMDGVTQAENAENGNRGGSRSCQIGLRGPTGNYVVAMIGRSYDRSSALFRRGMLARGEGRKSVMEQKKGGRSNINFTARDSHVTG